MKNKIGLFWLKDDFRIKKNFGLSNATKKHDQVVVFYLYKKKLFEKQEAQKWWVGKSLQIFRKSLNRYNISLEIVEVDSYKDFFKSLFDKKNFSIYWNKTYEPDFIEFDKYLTTNFKKKNIQFNVFKGNILNEFNEVSKGDGTPFKVFTPFWRNAEKFFMDKIPQKQSIISKCNKKV